MITLKGVKDYIKSLGVGDYFYIGKLDAKKEKSVGVYARETNAVRVPFGGLDCKKYDVKGVTLLVHWTNNQDETEIASKRLFDALQTATDAMIDYCKVYYFDLLNVEPIDVDRDNNGIYERVIQLDIYTERK